MKTLPPSDLHGSEGTQNLLHSKHAMNAGSRRLVVELPLYVYERVQPCNDSPFSNFLFLFQKLTGNSFVAML
jgi:hypothetical protein